jgi:hypothetical protein
VGHERRSVVDNPLLHFFEQACLSCYLVVHFKTTVVLHFFVFEGASQELLLRDWRACVAGPVFCVTWSSILIITASVIATNYLL